MKTVRYKKGFVNTQDYNSKLHFDNVYCLDCNKAKVKLVRKPNQTSFFKYIDGSLHDIFCPRLNKNIDNEIISSLVKSDSKQDLSRLNYIVNKNLEKLINLLTKIANDGNLSYSDTLELMPNKKKFMAKNKVREYVKQDIQTISAYELVDLDLLQYKNQYVMIYGVAGISLSTFNNKTKLVFKTNQDNRFSIHIPPNQLQYLDFDNSRYGKFAVFGKLKVSRGIINLDIRSTKDLVVN